MAEVSILDFDSLQFQRETTPPPPSPPPSPSCWGAVTRGLIWGYGFTTDNLKIVSILGPVSKVNGRSGVRESPRKSAKIKLYCVRITVSSIRYVQNCIEHYCVMRNGRIAASHVFRLFIIVYFLQVATLRIQNLSIVKLSKFKALQDFWYHMTDSILFRLLHAKRDTTWKIRGWIVKARFFHVCNKFKLRDMFSCHRHTKNNTFSFKKWLWAFSRGKVMDLTLNHVS